MYILPAETPPQRFWRLAVRPVAPLWAVLLIGSFPAIAWSAANAFFLGCRDARTQLAWSAAMFILFKGIGLATSVVQDAGLLQAWFGPEEKLVAGLAGDVVFLFLWGILYYTSSRQYHLASYLKSLHPRRRLSWGLPLIAVLSLFAVFAVPVIDQYLPGFARFWGQLILWRAFL